MSYSARVIADSVSEQGVRLTTMEVVFPRFILAELNTHRMLSRNSASSRAIPTELLIERVRHDPFVPETFNHRVKGMGVGAPLEITAAAQSRQAWIQAARNAADTAEQLVGLNVDKSRANRLLEPFLWHTAIISATEWDNFFGLRIHPGAQPEMQITAKAMLDAMDQSDPQILSPKQWHLPLISAEELRTLCDYRDVPDALYAGIIEEYKLVSVRRCARVSWDKHNDDEEWAVSISKALELKGNGHLSPFEHIARPLTIDDIHNDGNPFGSIPMGIVNDDLRPENVFVGNMKGWMQFRKEVDHESNFKDLLERQAV